MTARSNRCQKDIRQYWLGLAPTEWQAKARDGMRKVYTSVRKKGFYGGVLRREFYRRKFVDFDSFRQTLDALQSVTERLEQDALSVKKDTTQTSRLEQAVASTSNGPNDRGSFPVNRFFDNPTAHVEWLAEIDPFKGPEATKQKPGGLREAPMTKPWSASHWDAARSRGRLLAWFARPTLDTLLDCLADNHSPTDPQDPRARAWYVA